jgi:hypothetical protein
MPETVERSAANTTRVGYEVANALGALWAVRPKLAALCERQHNYALAIQTYLRAIDFYCLENGIRPDRVHVETFIDGDRLVQRITG